MGPLKSVLYFLENDKDEIYLLVGTSNGHILMYQLKSQSKGISGGGDSRMEVQLVKSNKYFSKRAILQLEVISDYEILISLSGK